MNICNIYPQRVFHFFNEISKIPRGSKKEKQISDWLVNFAKERNLEVKQDEALNVLIKKGATEGYENYSPIIIQGHMDMVWEKNKETVFDFEKEGIKLKIEDGFLKAEGTTLGADNGIAVAYALAILDSNELKHPSLEVIITSDEEDGMSGVNGLDYNWFSGKTLVNLDTEEYGEIYVSSAGGGRTRTFLTFNKKEMDIEKYTLFNVEVKGLSGGHSGAEIHLGLGNSNKILAEVLRHLSLNYNMSLCYIDGGEKVNAIPREAFVQIGVELGNDTPEDFIKLANLAFENTLTLFKVIDKNPIIEIKVLNENELIEKGRVCVEDTKKLISLLCELPNGVLKMSEHISGLVETSVNVGVIKTEHKDDEIIVRIQALPRSSVNNSLQNLIEEIKGISGKYDGEVLLDSSYPSWEYKEISPIRDIIFNSFVEITGKEPKIKAIHAGLECGIFADNIKNLDVVSIGPNIYGAHTPEERMEIDSVGKTWDLIVKMLENYNIK